MSHTPSMGNPSGSNTGWKFVATFVAGAVIGVASTVQVVPNFRGTQVAAGPASSGLEEVIEGAGSTAAGPGAQVKGGKGEAVAAAGSGPAGAPGTLSSSRPGLDCAPGKNGGATDQGITAETIDMATTVAESGFAAAFLGEVRFGMEAVRSRINRGGGICGRQLAIEYRDDAWDAARGAQYLRNFIQQRVFAIPVAPSSEGLRVVIDSGDIDKSGVPVVGTDGMLINQYSKPNGSAQPWVWPVAAATVSSARVMCHDAYRRGARNFSIVFDKNYKFGVEGAEAFNACVRKLTGKNISGYNPDYNCDQSFCGIIAAQQSYSGDAARFQEGDFVALFLEPQTAEKWMGDPNTTAANNSAVKYGYGAAQPLLTRSFAVNCQSKCHTMQIWTGFKPPIEEYAQQPAVKAYVQDLKRTKPDADEFNAFTEGGFVGMLLLEAALKKVGPDLTRERLRQALNGTCIDTGLTIQERICYSPNTRFANVTMQAFAIQYPRTFAGWRAGKIVRDPGA